MSELDLLESILADIEVFRRWKRASEGRDFVDDFQYRRNAPPMISRFPDAVRTISRMLARIIRYCDTIERLHLRSTNDVAVRRREMFRQAETFLNGAFREIAARKLSIRIKLGQHPDLTDLKRPHTPLVLSSGHPLFRVGRYQSIVSDEYEERFYVDFANGIAALDDLRRIRRCNWCSRYYIRQRIQRQEMYFCSDACRIRWHNRNRKQGE